MKKIYTLKYLLLAFSFVVFNYGNGFAQDKDATINKLKLVADGILKNSTFQFVDENTGRKFTSTSGADAGSNLLPESAYNDWRYWNGVLNIAMINLSESLNDPSYKDFAIKNIAFSFDNYPYFEKKYDKQNKWSYPFAQRFITEELDDCGAMGASVIEVCKYDLQQRYMDYVVKSADHIMNKQTRFTDKTFVRGFPVKWTLWADDLYMGLSFTARMGALTGDKKYFNDAANQVINFHKYLFDNTMGVMHHCWYSDLKRTNVALWGRANGWAIVAQVELLDRLPQNHPKRNELINLLRNHIIGVSRYQAQSGLWHQLLDKNDSYPETSCTAMFTYAVARAVNKGYLPARYASIALRGWEGVMTKIMDDGKIEGVCAGTVTSDDLIYYYNRPTPLNDIHGIGTIIMAGTEILNLIK